MLKAGTRPTLIVLLVLLAVWHGWPFTVGYRLTADSIFFLNTILQGPDAVWDTTKWMAEGHGRIGFYALMPINMTGSYLSEGDGWRGLFVVLYIAMVALAFTYAARLLKSPMMPLAFLIWLSLHPLLFEHTPPTSYPLQNTLPFLLLIGVRLWLLERTPRGALFWLAQLLQAFAMLLTEFATLLGLVMVGGEVLVRHPLRWRNPLIWFKNVSGDRKTWSDLSLIAVVLGAYVIYRQLYGADYEGTQISTDQNYWDLAYTTLFHVLDGISVARFNVQIFQAPLEAWALAAMAGMALAGALLLTLDRPLPRLPAFAVSFYTTLGILVVTLPLSLTKKQQNWCVSGGECAYLDSRTSILGVVLIVVALLSTLRLDRRAVKLPVAGMFGGIFMLTSIHNWQESREMRDFAVVWERAQMLSCTRELLPATRKKIQDLVDPNGILVANEAFWALNEGFWVNYINAARSWTRCELDHPVLRDAKNKSYLPKVRLGEFKASTERSFRKHLGSGWSRLEATGIWSDSTKAELIFQPEGVSSDKSVSLLLRGHVFLDEKLQAQRMFVEQDGEVIWRTTVAEGRQPACCAFEIPLLPLDSDAEVTLKLNFPDAAAPYKTDDARTLGIFLEGFEITQE